MTPVFHFTQYLPSWKQTFSMVCFMTKNSLNRPDEPVAVLDLAQLISSFPVDFSLRSPFGLSCANGRKSTLVELPMFWLSGDL